MRATGIIRRVDDLGRIVIPKDVCRQLGIEEGQPMELSFDASRGVVQFTKYEPGQAPHANDWYAEVRWHVDDIIGIAAEKGIVVTPEQAHRWWLEHERAFTEQLIQTGNEILAEEMD